MTTVPELTPTTCPALSTVAMAGLLLDQTKLTLGIRCESPGATICHAVAFAVVSFPRIRILRRVTLTCTEESRSVGYTHAASVAELNSSASAAMPRVRRMDRGPPRRRWAQSIRSGPAGPRRHRSQSPAPFQFQVFGHHGGGGPLGGTSRPPPPTPRMRPGASPP